MHPSGHPEESLGLDVNLFRVTHVPNLVEQNNPVLLLEWHDSCDGAPGRRGHHFVYHRVGHALVNVYHLDMVSVGYVEAV